MGFVGIKEEKTPSRSRQTRVDVAGLSLSRRQNPAYEVVGDYSGLVPRLRRARAREEGFFVLVILLPKYRISPAEIDSRRRKKRTAERVSVHSE